ncbi:symmetrical bis(5'-nucleosyl)-tetraphosphatase [Chitinibacter sp. SCUT-21]|uniref:symmetrical bis(5'-nucleosyl)-tetraphosphatase n=1 Tax=Chitinibacter sp. SCUT-21 TaxID=2970891 RepID=UPI0035A5831F
MANYVIGDVQGCYDELQALLLKIQFDPLCDHLYFVGDLVNRGPESYKVIKWVYEYRCCASTVLGNHDLFLLACWLGFATPRNGDTIGEILEDEHAELYLEWLIQQPLLLQLDNAIIAHAGIYPFWSQEQAIKRAFKAQKLYSGIDRHRWFSVMFGNRPDFWDKSLSDSEKFRFTINAFTRMRFLDGKTIDLKYKGELIGAPTALIPWFSVHNTAPKKRIFFGHWSALGLQVNDSYVCLDTGCIWGGQMTAYCLDTDEIFSISARRAYQSIAGEN